jgi:hypothetical protein
MDESEPQFPEKTSTTAEKFKEPATERECDVAVAVNLYHTSSSASPEQPGILCVAPEVVPTTGELHTEFEVSDVADEQSSDCAKDVAKIQHDKIREDIYFIL